MPKFFTKENQSEQTPEHDGSQVDPIKTLLSWQASARPFRKKDRSYYTTIAIIVILLVLISFLAHEFLLIGVLLSLAFVTYVLGFIPPGEVEYKISTQGITVGDHFYFWSELDSFWIGEKEGHKILHILTTLRFPGQLMLVLGNQEDEEIKKVVAKYLPFHEIAPKSLMDKWAEGLQKHFPLENPHR